MRRSVGRAWGSAPLGPDATMVSNELPDAPRAGGSRCRAPARTRARWAAPSSIGADLGERGVGDRPRPAACGRARRRPSRIAERLDQAAWSATSSRADEHSPRSGAARPSSTCRPPGRPVPTPAGAAATTMRPARSPDDLDARPRRRPRRPARGAWSPYRPSVTSSALARASPRARRHDPVNPVRYRTLVRLVTTSASSSRLVEQRDAADRGGRHVHRHQRRRRASTAALTVDAEQPGDRLDRQPVAVATEARRSCRSRPGPRPTCAATAPGPPGSTGAARRSGRRTPRARRGAPTSSG